MPCRRPEYRSRIFGSGRPRRGSRTWPAGLRPLIGTKSRQHNGSGRREKLVARRGRRWKPCSPSPAQGSKGSSCRAKRPAAKVVKTGTGRDGSMEANQGRDAQLVRDDADLEGGIKPVQPARPKDIRTAIFKNIRGAGEFTRTPAPEQKWLVEGFLPRRVVCPRCGNPSWAGGGHCVRMSPGNPVLGLNSRPGVASM